MQVEHCGCYGDMASLLGFNVVIQDLSFQIANIKATQDRIQNKTQIYSMFTIDTKAVIHIVHVDFWKKEILVQRCW